MTSKSPSKPTYTFRAFWALLLLAGNFLVAAYYFGLLK
ncbi:photosystem I protein PsaX [Leptolyngbya sp. AN02str]